MGGILILRVTSSSSADEAPASLEAGDLSWDLSLVWPLLTWDDTWKCLASGQATGLATDTTRGIAKGNATGTALAPCNKIPGAIISNPIQTLCSLINCLSTAYGYAYAY